MIRTAQHIAPLRQLQLRLELAARRTRQALNARRRDLRAMEDNPAQPAVLISAQATSAPPVSAGPLEPVVPQDYRNALMSAFADYYAFEAQLDGLVQTLCLAAHQGVTAERNLRYQSQRVWFLNEYDVVKADLADYLTASDADLAITPLGPQPCDAFEGLFLPASLDLMLDSDNGTVIDRLNRAQAALSAWLDDLNRTRRDLGY